MPCRGIRGATTVESDSASAILSATRELLASMLEANRVQTEDVASAVFTVTPDLKAAFPAQAARQLGWQHVPLLDAQEIPVPGSLPRCVRVLLHWNTDTPQQQVRHVYLRGAAVLRPDLEAGHPAQDEGPTATEPN
ncbi:MAG: chorismate mutase [Anaerolineae bacterium]